MKRCFTLVLSILLLAGIGVEAFGFPKESAK